MTDEKNTTSNEDNHEVVMESHPSDLMDDEHIEHEQPNEAQPTAQRKKKKAVKKIDLLILLSLLAIALCVLFSFLTVEEYGNMKLSFAEQQKQQAKEHLLQSKRIIDAKVGVLYRKLNRYPIKNIAEFSAQLEQAEFIQTLSNKIYPGSKLEVLRYPIDYVALAEDANYGYAFVDMVGQIMQSADENIHTSNFEAFNPATEQQQVVIARFVGNKQDDSGYILFFRLDKTFLAQMFASIAHDPQFKMVQGSSSRIVYQAGSSTAMPLVPMSIPQVREMISFTKWHIVYLYPESEMNIFTQMSILFTLYAALAVCSFLFAGIVFGRRLKRFIATRKLQHLADEQQNNMLSDADALEKLSSQQDTVKDIWQKNKTRENDQQLSMRDIFQQIVGHHGIRGIVGETITPDVMNILGLIIGEELNELGIEQISVGFDGRNEGEALSQALIDGLQAQKIKIYYLAQTLTPLLYFAAVKKTQGYGLMITAGSAAANYNGMRILFDHEILGGSKLARMFHAEETFSLAAPAKEKPLRVNVQPAYQASLLKIVKFTKPIHIVVDAGNGLVGQYVSELLQASQIKVSLINNEPDASFPQHQPDPSKPVNFRQLMDEVKQQKADLGVLFNSDATALGIVSSNGEIIWADKLLNLFAKDLLARKENAKILYDVKSSSSLHDEIQALGGDSDISPSGVSALKERMNVQKAMVAGEFSGHILLKERWTGFDDAIYALARLLDYLSQQESVHHCFAQLPAKVCTPEILLAVQPGQLAGIISKIVVQKDEFSDAGVITIDGLRVEYADGWGVVRASHTSNALSLRFEADNAEALQRIADKFKEVILSVVFVKFPY